MPNLTKKQQEVFEACNSLFARGEKIIIDAVGQELLSLGYKRGSNTILAQYVREWRTSHSTIDNITSFLPQRPDRLTQTIDQIRVEMAREAEEKLASYQAASDAKLQEMMQTLSFSQEEIKQVREQNLLLEKNLSEKTHRLIAAEDRCDRLGKELTETLTQAAHDNEQAQTKILTLQEEKNTLMLELGSHRHSQENIAKEHRSTISDMMEKMEALRHQQMLENDKLKTELHRTEKLLEKSLQAQTQLHEQNDALKKQLLIESHTKAALDLVADFFKNYKTEQSKSESFNNQLLNQLNQLISTASVEQLFQNFSTKTFSEIGQLAQMIKITQETIEEVKTLAQIGLSLEKTPD